jgi:hypothetical protein
LRQFYAPQKRERPQPPPCSEPKGRSWPLDKEPHDPRNKHADNPRKSCRTNDQQGTHHSRGEKGLSAREATYNLQHNTEYPQHAQSEENVGTQAALPVGYTRHKRFLFYLSLTDNRSCDFEFGLWCPAIDYLNDSSVALF